MTKVLMERVDWIEKALVNEQITKSEAMAEIDWIDVIIDLKELEDQMDPKQVTRTVKHYS